MSKKPLLNEVEHLIHTTLDLKRAVEQELYELPKLYNELVSKTVDVPLYAPHRTASNAFIYNYAKWLTALKFALQENDLTLLANDLRGVYTDYPLINPDWYSTATEVQTVASVYTVFDLGKLAFRAGLEKLTGDLKS